MSDDYVDFSARRVTGPVGRHKMLVTLAFLVGAGVASGLLMVRGVEYTAESQVSVGQPVTLQSLTSSFGSSVDQSRLVDLQQRVIESDSFAADVDDKLPEGHDSYSVSVTGVTAVNVIGIKVTSIAADLAATVANEFADHYVSTVTKDNQAKINRAKQSITAQIEPIDAQLVKLARRLDRKPDERAVIEPQRTALLDQKLALESRQSQIDLAENVDPSGGATVISSASTGTASLGSTVISVAIGGFLGLLIGLGLVALLEMRRRPGV